jgi:tetratricopeptide (TPR) repeat protein
MMPDPYAPHLRQADDLFARDEIVKAGQIWQAILKQQPTHTEARERLLIVKQRLLALREAEAAAAAPPPPPPIPPVPPIPEPSFPPPEAMAAPVAPPPVAPEPVLPEPVPARPILPEPVPTPDAPPVPEPARVITGTLDPERLVAHGCTLYDMGQTEDALHKWEQALALDPAHALARGYANGVRRELGLPPLEAPAAAAPVALESHAQDEDIDKLLREAVQLYDMGLEEEAISKWERVLVLEPHRHEVEGYLRQARVEVANSRTPAPAPEPAAASTPTGPEALDLKLRQAEHLLTLQRHEEAAFTFQQALGLDPGNARALQGLERCRKPTGRTAPTEDPRPAPVVTLDSRGRIAMAVDEASYADEPQGVEPPAALLKATPAPREGLSLPERFRGAVEQMPWLKNPIVLALVGGGLLVLLAGSAIVHSYRKDQALKEDVSAARAAAVAPVAQQAQVPDLAESPAALRQEAEATLGTDPLRAYLRAETLVARNPGDAAGPQLLEKARAGLPGGVTGASLAEFQKHLQNGDLEAAARVMDALLRAQPGDGDLRARAARLHLTLCSAHAAQGKWDEAQEDLFRGRALFPGDRTWLARLKLLDRVKTLPKAKQAEWLSLLG